jgi:ATP-dependent 26S proteasome regulatory subunit
MNPDYFIIPLIMGQVSHLITALKTDYVIIDCCLFALAYLLYYHVNIRDVKRRLFSVVKNTSNKQTVVLVTSEGKRTTKFRAIMHYLSKSNKTIYKVREISDISWDDDEEIIKEKSSQYLIDQSKEFALTDNIYGIITNNTKEKCRGFSGTEYIDLNILKIYSYSLTLLEIQQWVNGIVKEYKQFLKTSSNETQLYITVSVGKKRIESEGKSHKTQKANEMVIEAVPWESTIRFENSYFHDMKEIIKKIDFFLNNKQWYLEKGIPYNLGILLYGEPGCGKTRFIKQLMNHTGRHAIDIKLNDSMNFQDLYNIIFKEEISEDYIIPQEQRMLIFEDIDAMGESIKCRDLKDKPKNDVNVNDKNNSKYNDKEKSDDEFISVASCNSLTDLIKNEMKKSSKTDTISDLFLCENSNININTNKNNDNLSYLLNMFDGINECSGRIIIMTSNKPEVLDKALIRPGRIDIKINFQKCTRYDVMSLINLFWKIDIKENMLLPDINYKYTSAEIYNIFRTTNEFDDIKKLFVL